MQVRISSGRFKFALDLSGGPPVAVRDALLRLAASHPATRAAWTDESGRLRDSLQVFVNGENVRYRGGLACPLVEGDEVYVIPLIAGG
jgi:sulfur-carrier protein